MLPGQRYAASACIAAGVTSTGSRPRRAHAAATSSRTSSGSSRGRSRSGGSVTVAPDNR
jgi:hypothetical protein